MKNISTRILALCACLLLVLSCALPALAAPAIPTQRLLPRVVDNAGLLNTAQKNALLQTLDDISTRQKCDVVIVTVKSLEGKTSEAFADDFFDYNGYGNDHGSERNGILFLQATQDRDWAISTHGYGIESFTDAGQNYMMEKKVLPLLREDNYNDAYTAFAEQCDIFLTQAREGKPFDVGNMPKKPPLSPAAVAGISLCIGLLLALIVTSTMKQPLKSVKKQVSASTYTTAQGLNVTASHEAFLYNSVARTAIPKSDDSGGGGSSTHSSSSGSTHGGSSGKY